MKLSASSQIQLPTWLASCDLTITEIGLITAIACLQSRNGCEVIKGKLVEPEMEPVIQGLIDRGIVEIKLDEVRSHMEIHINLDPCMPPDIKALKDELDRGEVARGN